MIMVLSAILFSCEKDEEQFVATTSGTPVLNASAQTLELLDSESSEEALVLSWTPVEVSWSNPEYAPDGAMKYYLQFDQAGDNFDNPVEVDMGTSLEQSYTVVALNTFLIERLDLVPFTQWSVEIRVKASLGANQEGAFSDPVTLTITPYEVVEISYAPIYMVGDATEGGWDNALASPMFLSETAEGVFVYTGLFKAGQFKFLKMQGQWAPMWGADGNGTLVPRPTEDDPDPASIAVATEGYYTVAVDTANLTYTFEPFDASGATNYESIGIIGAFTNWETDVLMTQSAFDPHIWMVDYEFAEATPMKFRTAGDWAVNWGPATDEEKDTPWGLGVQDGKDINVVAGNYTIYFNDLTGNYMFIPQQ